MTKQKILLVIALAVIGCGAGLLSHMKANQRLGEPGVKTEAIAGSKNVRVVLPQKVLSFDSEEIPQAAIVTNVLPADTSYGQRRYISTVNSNDWLLVNVVLMGADRTSLHKPQYCLEGSGWRINNDFSTQTNVPIALPQPYDLPVIKLVSAQTFKNSKGEPVEYRGIYVYWFVADDALSGDMSGRERMWWMAKDLLLTGVLQRWAYVSCFTVCLPGEEDAMFERMKRFIAASVPEFQLTPKPAATTLSSNP